MERSCAESASSTRRNEGIMDLIADDLELVRSTCLLEHEYEWISLDDSLNQEWEVSRPSPPPN